MKFWPNSRPITLVQIDETDVLESQAISCQYECIYKTYLSSCSQDIERKQYFLINQGP